MRGFLIIHVIYNLLVKFGEYSDFRNPQLLVVGSGSPTPQPNTEVTKLYVLNIMSLEIGTLVYVLQLTFLKVLKF